MIKEPEAHKAGDSTVYLLVGRCLDGLTVLEAVGVNYGVGEAVSGDGIWVEGDLVTGESKLKGVYGSVEAPICLRNRFEVRLPYPGGSEE